MLSGFEISDETGKTVVSSKDKIGSFIADITIPATQRQNSQGTIFHPAFDKNTPFVHLSGRPWAVRFSSYNKAASYGVYPFEITLTKINGGIQWNAKYLIGSSRYTGYVTASYSLKISIGVY